MNKPDNISNFNAAANLLNTRFYQAISSDFSRTRQNSWPGWEKFAQDIFAQLPEYPYILDFACGNMRFAKFCGKIIPQFNYLGLDNNKALADSYEKTCLQAGQKLAFNKVDLLKDSCQSCLLNNFNLVVSFGFFHHIPSYKKRIEILQQLIDAAVQGGFVAISLWQFMKDKKIATKAQASTNNALQYFETQAQYQALLQTQKNDYFLSWDQAENVYRYCHNFEEAEIDSIVSDIKTARLISSFNADGKNNALNRYLVFQKE